MRACLHELHWDSLKSFPVSDCDLLLFTLRMVTSSWACVQTECDGFLLLACSRFSLSPSLALAFLFLRLSLSSLDHSTQGLVRIGQARCCEPSQVPLQVTTCVSVSFYGPCSPPVPASWRGIIEVEDAGITHSMLSPFSSRCNLTRSCSTHAWHSVPFCPAQRP
ncbi:hypothetical protein BCR44DRAFT_279335 [Catenaria anguillulae PL171]|uniref:Uncharacterized protein n=1 Tax=Catenaria anguillulae PL171 TaxID=765915 RepID=A0A1Y2HS73_9FUNG|nr:hypothetical protein BCR44DRAFT_279335 [Catenaria anguillulae PL171]